MYNIYEWKYEVNAWIRRVKNPLTLEWLICANHSFVWKPHTSSILQEQKMHVYDVCANHLAIDESTTYFVQAEANGYLNFN